MCQHILVIKLVDGGKHTAKECADKEELDAAIADAQSRPGTAGYEIFDLVAKVRKSIEWREVDVEQAKGNTAQAGEAGQVAVADSERVGDPAAGSGESDLDNGSPKAG